jgi:tape measure domain-containing protein
MSSQLASLAIEIQTGSLKRASAELDKLTKVGLRAEKGTNNLTKSTKTLGSSLFTLQSAFIAVGGAMAIGKLIEYADTMTRLESQIKLVTGSSQELLKTQTDLFKLSQETRQSLESTTNLYARMARATEELGTSDEDLLKATKSVNQALVISGASATESSSAITQLSQALASGVLRGEEFNSIAENGSRIARALADSLGVSIGQLRAMSKEGKLTSEVVMKALIEQAPKLASEFEKMGITVEQSGVVLNNSLLVSVKRLNEVTGATKSLSSGIISLSKFLDNNTESIISVGKGVTFTATAMGSFYLATKSYTILSPILSALLVKDTIKFNLYGQAIARSAVASRGLSLALKSIPFIAIAGLITILATKWFEANEAHKAYNATAKKTNEDLLAGNRARVSQLEKLIDSGRFNAKTVEMWKNALKRLNAEYDVLANKKPKKDSWTQTDTDLAGFDDGGIDLAIAQSKLLYDEKKKQESVFNTWKLNAIQKNSASEQANWEIWAKERQRLFEAGLKKDAKATDKFTDNLSDNLQTQMTGAIVNGIEAGLTDGSLQSVVAGFASGVGNAISQAYISQMIKTQAISAGALGGLAVGVGVMAIGASMAQLAESEQKLNDSIDRLIKVNEELAKLSTPTGEFLKSDLESTALNFQTSYNNALKAQENYNISVGKDISDGVENSIDSVVEGTLSIVTLGISDLLGFSSSLGDTIASWFGGGSKKENEYETAVNNSITALKSQSVAIINATDLLIDFGNNFEGLYDKLTNTSFFSDIAGKQALADVESTFGGSLESILLKLGTQFDIENVEQFKKDLASDISSEEYQNALIKSTQLLDTYGANAITMVDEIALATDYQIKINDELAESEADLADARLKATQADLASARLQATQADLADARLKATQADLADARLKATQAVNNAMLGSLSYLSEMEKLTYANNIYQSAITQDDRVSSSRTIAQISQGTTRTREDYVPIFQQYLNELQKQDTEATLTDVVEQLIEVNENIIDQTESATDDATYATGT